MNEKKNVYETDVIGLPPLRSVLGEVPNPDPVRNRPGLARIRKPGREMESTVRRLIAHLENERVH